MKINLVISLWIDEQILMNLYIIFISFFRWIFLINEKLDCSMIREKIFCSLFFALKGISPSLFLGKYFFKSIFCLCALKIDWMMIFRSPFEWAQSSVSFIFYFIFTKNLFFKNCQNLSTFMKIIYDSYYLLFIFFSIQNMNRPISTDSPFISRLIHQYLFSYRYEYIYRERINTI
jgi:hypothetical protein